MAIVTSISTKLLENFVDFIAKKIQECFIPQNQEHVGYLGLTAASVLLLLFVVDNFFGWKLGGDLVNSILKKIGEYCVPQIIREQVGYLTDYDSNIMTLEAEVEKLEGIQNKMQDFVNKAKENGQRVGPRFDSVLTELRRIDKEVQQFLEATVNKRWLCGLCPDLISRYKLSSEAKKKKKMMQDVIRPLENNTELFFSDFESRLIIMDQIMAALKDDNINVIGICGLGGIGKTTTVNKVDKSAKEEKLFDVTVMAVVSQTPDLIKIKGEIAAVQLREEMKKHKRILVILDDVWEPLNLEAAGIPFGCKVMLTSRSEDVCKQICRQMRSFQNRRDMNFKIDALSEPEAWDLFKENAGNSIESPRLHSVAKEVVNECGGLPLAIVTVGRALEDKAPHHWKDALRKLRMPNPENVPDFLRYVYGKLELSYDFLKNREQKSLLLLCCIFKEDTDIPIRDLVRNGMGLLMFKGIDALAAATDTVRTLVDDLKRCNLLLDNGKEDCVRMHDLVRDVIRFKATKGKEVFMLRYGPELKEWPTEGTDEQYASVSLISNQLARPKPDLLLLEGMREVPDKGMEELKVLQMRQMVIPSLPSLLSYLTNLRALSLHHCELGSISTIGKLQTLVILSFHHCSIKELPPEIRNLTHLRLLDLTECSLEIVSPGVISSLTQLEELYLKDSGLKWVVEEGGEAQNEVNLAEIGFLSNLSALVSPLPTIKFLGNSNLFDKLVRFQLISNAKYPQLEFSADSEFENFLVLDDIDATTLADGETQVLLKKTDSLKIRGVRGMEHVLNNHDSGTHHPFNEKDVYGCEKLLNVFSSNLVQSLQNLEKLQVNNCHLLEVVFDFEGVNIEERHAASVLPCLKKLELQYLRSLTHLWKKAPQKIQGFQNLQSLVVVGCGKLKYIFTPSIAKLLVKLENLQTSNCNKLSNVVPSNSLSALQNLEELSIEKCGSLEEVFEVEGLNVEEGERVLLPNLKKLNLEDLPELKHLFNEKVAFPSLEELKLTGVSKINEIWCKMDHEGTIGFQYLKSLNVFGCGSLRNVFYPSMARGLVHLKYLNISSCKMMEEIVVKWENEGDRTNKKIVIPQLEKLVFFDLPRLISFCQGLYPFDLPLLVHVSIDKCPEMKTFSSKSPITPKLKVVKGDYDEQFWMGEERFYHTPPTSRRYCYGS